MINVGPLSFVSAAAGATCFRWKLRRHGLALDEALFTNMSRMYKHNRAGHVCYEVPIDATTFCVLE